jgi:hypothetical protein
MDSPTVAVQYDVEMLPNEDDDEDDDEDDIETVWLEEKHLCGFACLASWAMTQAMDEVTQ